MEYLPIALRVHGRTCLVVGGGPVALRKASLMLRAGAHLIVVAPQLLEEFDGLRGVTLVRRAYAASDVEGAMLAIAATDDRALNAQVAADAAQRGVLVNVVDEPQHCTFVMPSIVDRSPLLVAISTAGAAPVLARMVRGEIEALLPPGLGALSDLLSRQRRAIKEALPDLTDRRRFMEAMLAGPVAEMAQAADSTLAEAELLRRLAAFTSEEARLLTVVGTGPGDPDLLTFQAQRFMQQADHVFHESDVSDAILERCRRDAPRTELPIGGQVDLAKRAASAGRAALLVVGDGQRQARALMNTPGSDAFVIRHVRGLPTGDAAT